MTLGIIKEIIMEMEIYLQIKEELVYSHVPNSISALSIEWDIEIKQTLDTMKRADWSDPWILKNLTSELIQQIEEQFNIDEHQVFPVIKKLPDEPFRKAELGLRKLPQYSASQPEIVQNPSGGEQRRKQHTA